MMHFLLNIDKSIFLFFNGMHSHYSDIVFYWISNRFVWIPLYLTMAYFMVKHYGKKSWIYLAMIVSIIFLSDQSCNLIKKTVQRPRPSHEITLSGQVHLVTQPNGKLYKGGPYGFPSSHAANSIALALFMTLFLSHHRHWPFVLLFVWVLLLSYSRIYLGVHYPGDIIAGWLVGTLWSLLFYYVTIKYKNSKQPAH